MPASTTKRILAVIAAILGVAMIALGVHLYRSRRPVAPPAPVTAAAPATLGQLPPDAPGLAYIDVVALRKLQGSTLASLLGLAGPAPAEDRDYQDFVRGTGFDYTRDLDNAAIAFWLANRVDASNNSDTDQVVVIAEGRFDQTKIDGYALRTGHVVTRGSEQIYEVPGKPPVAFEFLAPNRILLASGKNPASLLGPYATARRDPAVQTLIDRVAAAPLFAVARTDNLPPTFYDSFRSSPQLAGVARDIQGLTLAGQPSGNDLQLALDAECSSMAHAMEMSTLLDGLRLLGSMALSDPKTRRQMTHDQIEFANAVLGQAKISHQDRWVRVSLDVTPAMLGEKTSASDP